MRTDNFIMIPFLFACEEPAGIEETMPVEIIDCTHPDSQFEAAVSVEVEDDIQWDKVHFEISQGERIWKTRLQTEDHVIWWTKMQLIELDCFSSFDYSVNYEYQ
jgi:hypothetical protein